jgi:hypothetical protein
MKRLDLGVFSLRKILESSLRKILESDEVPLF